jgi:hypothetical protein
MNIRPLGIDKQYGLKGNVINVPVNIYTSVSVYQDLSIKRIQSRLNDVTNIDTDSDK